MANHNHLQSLPNFHNNRGDLAAAREFAAQAHAGQVRKLSGEAMIDHPYGVTNLLQATGESEATQIAAVLHDTVETGGVTLGTIHQQFGPQVGAIVDGVTKRETFATREQKLQDYLHRLEHEAPIESLLVSLADKIDNIEDIIAQYTAQGDDIWQYFKGGAHGTLQWHHDVLQIAERKLPQHPLTERLRMGVAHLRALLLGRHGVAKTAMDS